MPIFRGQNCHIGTISSVMKDRLKFIDLKNDFICSNFYLFGKCFYTLEIFGNWLGFKCNYFDVKQTKIHSEKTVSENSIHMVSDSIQ